MYTGIVITCTIFMLPLCPVSFYFIIIYLFSSIFILDFTSFCKWNFFNFISYVQVCYASLLNFRYVLLNIHGNEALLLK